MLADLHFHSIYSDGLFTPSEMATESEAGIIALSDHDTVDGVPDFLAAAKSLNKTALSAIELSTFLDEEIHIIGYNIDIKNSLLLDTLKTVKHYRNERNYKIIENLCRHGMPLTVEEVENGAKATVNRLHIGKAMIKRGYVKNFQEALNKYIGDGKCCAAPNYNIPVRDGIEIIKAAGGIPVFAHPGRCKAKGPGLNNIINNLVSYGIMGIEVYYPKHSEILIQILEKICDENNLIATAGSDRHGNPDETLYSHELNAKTKEVLRIL